MPALPVDAVLPAIQEAFDAQPNLVLTAPPGSGKTTRVPPALLAWLCGEILVLEPRRLAARLAAAFIADERHERLGDVVGYQVRFEEVASPRTRLRFVTEALLVRRLLSDPTLAGVSAVVFDEFHERHLQTDLGLALCRRLQAGPRPDLRLVVMSATLEATPIARYLGGCQTVVAEGRRFPVSIEHQRHPDPRPLATRVAAAVAEVVAASADGDILVFLPGAAEIRAAQRACHRLAERHALLLVPLFGDLPLEAQHRAIRKASKRKVILATNVAESSITVEGVSVVIDSGLARVASHDPWSGLPQLFVRPVSQAAAAQRAGRAGRTAPGRCVRLFTAHEHNIRPGFEKPEIERADLSELVLTLAALGVEDPRRLEWLTAPPEAALRGAQDLLRRLGALGRGGEISTAGRRMAELPLHPRHGRLLLEAEQRGCLEEAILAVAVLGERDVRLERGPTKVVAGSDLMELVETLRAAAASRLQADQLRARGLSPGPVHAVRQVQAQLARLMRRSATAGRGGAAPDRAAALGLAVLAGYPDRVARRRDGHGRPELLLAGGGSAVLDPSSVVQDSEWMVAVEAEVRERERGRAPKVRLASAIEPEWLLELCADRVRDSREVVWNEKAERVEVATRLTYEELVLDESRNAAVTDVEATPLLVERALAAGPALFAGAEAIEAFRVRVDLLRQHAPELELRAIDAGLVQAALAALCAGRRSFAELRAVGLMPAIAAQLSPAQLQALDRLAPREITLKSGRRLQVVYGAGRPPRVVSLLQDFFGSGAGPAIVGGRVALTLELLAPNRRPVQVTTDLAGFWRVHYPRLQKELSRRYPRHDWPEDPLHAPPPASGGRKRRPGR
ncbi:MAG: ATP-dependent helicase HrpB [Deltaproteobacteria bacterium]|nr:ATP-dependent helicase HrpB [Deltaproteobacteria bacterium]